MTAFRERDLLKVTQDGATRWNGGSRLMQGLIVRVKEVSPGGQLVKIYSSLLDADHLDAWWDVNRFELHEAARPVQPTSTRAADRLHGRDRAKELLSQAETKHNQGEGYQRVQPLALLGILHALLDEPKSEVQDLVRQLEEEWKARNKLRDQLDESWSEREALRHRVDELETERDDLKEKAEILEAELLVARNHVRAAVADRREAIEEIDRLNREQGVVPTREEAVSEVKGFAIDGKGATVADEDNDTARFEWCPVNDGDQSHSEVLLRPLSKDCRGVWISADQLEALAAESRRRNHA